MIIPNVDGELCRRSLFAESGAFAESTVIKHRYGPTPESALGAQPECGGGSRYNAEKGAACGVNTGGTVEIKIFTP